MPLYHHKEVFREIPGGAPVEGVSVSFWRLIDDTQIGSPVVTTVHGEAFKNLADTATSGKTSYELHPGPYRSEAASTSGVHREKSSTTIGSAGAIDLAAQIFLNRAMGTGVIQDPGSGLAEMAVTATGSSMVVTVASGAFVIGGMPGFNHLGRSITIPANATLAERIDLIVIEAIPQGNDEEGKKSLKLVQGTVTGVAPTLTKNETIIQEAIASISVPNGAGTIAQANITDLREFVERSVSDVADDVTQLQQDVAALQSRAMTLIGWYSGTVNFGTINAHTGPISTYEITNKTVGSFTGDDLVFVKHTAWNGQPALSLKAHANPSNFLVAVYGFNAGTTNITPGSGTLSIQIFRATPPS